MKKFSQFMQEAKLEMRGSSHGLAKMSASELEQEHKKVKERIDALGSNVPSSLTQRATLIKLHMKMRNKETVAEGNGTYVKHENPGEWRKAGYERGNYQAQHSGTRKIEKFGMDRKARDKWIKDQKKTSMKEEAEQIDEISKETAQSYLKKTVDPVEGMPRDNFKNLKTRLKGIARASKIVTKPAPVTEGNVSVGDDVWVKHPTQTYRTLSGKVLSVDNDSAKIQHRNGSIGTYKKSSVSADYNELNPNPYRNKK